MINLWTAAVSVLESSSVKLRSSEKVKIYIYTISNLLVNENIQFCFMMLLWVSCLSIIFRNLFLSFLLRFVNAFGYAFINYISTNFTQFTSCKNQMRQIFFWIFIRRKAAYLNKFLGNLEKMRLVYLKKSQKYFKKYNFYLMLQSAVASVTHKMHQINYKKKNFIAFFLYQAR